MNDKNNKVNQSQQLKKEDTKPNESSGVYVRGFVKITDPITGKIIVQTAN